MAIYSYLATVGHLGLDMLLAHVVDQPVLQVEALVADPKSGVKFDNIIVLEDWAENRIAKICIKFNLLKNAKSPFLSH